MCPDNVVVVHEFLSTQRQYHKAPNLSPLGSRRWFFPPSGFLGKTDQVWPGDIMVVTSLARQLAHASLRLLPCWQGMRLTSERTWCSLHTAAFALAHDHNRPTLAALGGGDQCDPGRLAGRTWPPSQPLSWLKIGCCDVDCGPH
jgi:hypothetical protein